MGKIGTPKRDKYEQELKIELLSEEIKALRISNNLTQDQLGELVGENPTSCLHTPDFLHSAKFMQEITVIERIRRD